MSLLELYNNKRNFNITPEPKGAPAKRGKALRFVIQKHDASHLHYDFRLEMEGVMKSWAVPKGPSLDPKVKRLAMETEDHPVSYNAFEGTIPAGEYGAGKVIVWDQGTYHSPGTKDPKESEREFLRGLKQGKLSFVLLGEKLQGEFSLARFGGRGSEKKQWILVKKKDAHASTRDVTLDNTSVLSERSLIGRTEDSSRYAKPNKEKARKVSGENAKLSRIRPMLATLTDKAFSDKKWHYEIKWDGYRALANVTNGTVDLYSRNGNDFNRKYPEIVRKLEKIQETVILDGEIVAYDEKGNVGFQALQNIETAHGVEYMIFDILHLEGEDIMQLPLLERKKILRDFLRKYPGLKESDYIERDGEKFFKLAVKKNIEGIMAKHRESRYLPNTRTEEWLKIKHHNVEEAVIAGFTEPRGSRKNFGALVLGQHDTATGTLKFIGHTGTGFNKESLQSLHKKLLPLVTKTSPFEGKIPLNAPITWVKPMFVAQIKFTEWTQGGNMRHPVFLGLREDKPADEVTAEKKVPAREALKKSRKDDGLKLTNEGKIYFPKLGITKGDVIAYYEHIAPFILPYLKDRPESLNRHPNGVGKPGFFQKNFTGAIPSFASTVAIRSDSTGEDVNYLVCQNKKTLLYMANLGCIEINPWNSRTGKLDYPDYMVFDIDPKESSWKNLIQVAKEVKKVLDESCQQSYIKTSGKSGLHIYVPLGAAYTFEDVRNFSHLVAQIVHSRLPDITSLERDPRKRKNKIYLDYLQNRIGQTTAAVYSLRPTENATVSTPLLWKELTVRLDPKKFNIFTMHKRLKKVGDIWKPVITEAVDLKRSIQCLEKSLWSAL